MKTAARYSLCAILAVVAAWSLHSLYLMLVGGMPPDSPAPAVCFTLAVGFLAVVAAVSRPDGRPDGRPD